MRCCGGRCVALAVHAENLGANGWDQIFAGESARGARSGELRVDDFDGPRLKAELFHIAEDYRFVEMQGVGAEFLMRIVLQCEAGVGFVDRAKRESGREFDFIASGGRSELKSGGLASVDGAGRG
jgi:hypothetical protein